jgi:hypothetical protein
MASRAPTEMEADMLKWLLIVLGIPVGIALVVIGAMSAVNASNMQSQGKLIEATITQSQADQSNGWEIKYEFRVGNGATLYSHSDETGRKNLWVTVAQKPTANTAQIKYLPSDPWVNDLASGGSNSMGSALTGLGVGVLLTCIGVFLLASEIGRRRKKKVAKAVATQ